MADYSQTASSVVEISNDLGNSIERGYTAAESLSAGMPVYIFDTAARTVKKANASTSATTAAVYGLAMNDAATGQPVAIFRRGKINPGFTGAVSDVVILSSSSGKLAPAGDLTTGMRAVILGVMPAASTLWCDFTTPYLQSSAAKA